MPPTKDKNKTKAQLIDEVTKLRKQVAKLKHPDNEFMQADKAIQKSKRMFRLLFEKTPYGLVVVNRKGKFLYTNKAAAKNLGYSKKEFMNLHITDIETRETEKDFKKHYSDMLRGKRIDFETQHKKKDGSIIDVHVSLNVFDHEGEKVTYSIWRNITERKKTEEALKDSEKKWASLTHNSDDYILIVDKEHIVQYVNKTIPPDTPEEIIGTKIYEHIPKGHYNITKKTINNVFKTGKPDIYEVILERPGIKTIWFGTRTIPIKTGKKVTKIILISTDITERKKTEDALKESEEKLSSIIQKSPIPTAAGGSEGAIITLNEALEKLVGYKQSEIKDINDWSRKLYPDKKYRTFVENNITQALSGQKQDCTEFTITCKDGSQKIVDFHTSFFKDGLIIQIIDITERKKAEEALQQEHDLFLHGPTFVIKRRAEKSWPVEYTSPNIQNVLGYEPKDFTSGRVQYIDCIHPNDLTRIIEEVDMQVKSDTNHYEQEYRFAGTDGEYRWLHDSTTMVRDSSGKVTHFHGYVLDITERRKTEEKLKESEEKYRSILENMNDTYYRTDLEGNLLMASPSGAALFGYDTSEELIGKNIADDFYYNSEDRKIFLEKIKQKGKVENYEVALKRKDGTILIGEVSSHFIYDTKGKPTGVEGIFRNATERKKAEEELEESEEKYRMIFDSANDIISQVDKTGKILSINNRVEEILGYKSEEIIGNNFTKIAAFKLADIPKILNILKNMVTGKKVLNLLELTTFHKDGSDVSLEINTRVIRKNGKFECLLSIIRDITERKRAEKEKNELESQLRQSEKMDSIGQLAGGIAHDFNNQLGSIVGFADLIRERVCDDATLSRYSDNILITARRSADITKQLLAFARKGKYKTVIVDMHNIIHEVISLLKHSIQKKIVIKQHFKANPSYTAGDPSQLQNMILNIAINARDAMPRGGEITFKTDTVSLDKDFCQSLHYNLPQGDYLQIDITDTGSGMDSETIQHIFEPFYTTKKVGKGTGMGLAAAYGTIKNHRGAIDVTSEKGHGTTFIIYLPLETEDAGEEMGTSKKSDLIKGSAHILLADDEEMLCEMAQDILESLGYKTTVCNNGKEAIEIYTKSWKDIDLVLLDMIMPVMDGRDVYIAMKKINPHVKVLLSSGYSITGQARELLSKGVDDFIQKPYRKAELSQKIAKVLGRAME